MVELPRQIDTERLLLRVPEIDDAQIVNDAIKASFAELHQWMDWALEMPSVVATRDFCRLAASQWEKREQMPMFMFLRSDGRFVGSSGFNLIDWKVPKAEIGYWCHTAYTGHGYVSEAATALTDFAFENLACHRVFMRVDARNERSCRVAERLGYDLEAKLQADMRANDGTLRNTLIYSKIRLPSG